jgi:hypothetical protein
MNDTQTLILIHTVAWPILIWALSKTWSSSRNAVSFFIGTHNETLSISVSVHNPNRSPLPIQS